MTKYLFLAVPFAFLAGVIAKDLGFILFPVAL